MTDLNQIRENSLTYNGPRSKITATAETMVAMGTKALDEVGGASVIMNTIVNIMISGGGAD